MCQEDMEKIMRAMPEQWLTYNELAVLMDKPLHSVGQYARKLRDKGIIVSQCSPKGMVIVKWREG